MRLAVLIPARNEAPRIGRVLAEVARALPEAGVWVIDDGGMDGTAEVARRAGATILRTPGLGYAGALATGYRALAAAGVEVAVQMDADGQHPPAEAPRLVAGLDGADLVVGSRHGTRSPAPLPRRLGNAALAGLVRLLTGVPLHDVTSGYWAVGPRALDALARHLPADVADANVRVLLIRLGLRVAERPVAMPARPHGASMHDGLRGLHNFGRSLGALARARRMPA